jgi:hypothetical protein
MDPYKFSDSSARIKIFAMGERQRRLFTSKETIGEVTAI